LRSLRKYSDISEFKSKTMKTIEQYIHELFQPWIDKSEDMEAVLNDKNVQETIDLARFYVERGENGMARFIADLLNEHYRTDIFTELCLQHS
jgi:Tfp pilus assembly protein FimV